MRLPLAILAILTLLFLVAIAKQNWLTPALPPPDSHDWEKKIRSYDTQKSARNVEHEHAHIEDISDWTINQYKSKFTDTENVTLFVNSEEKVNCGWNYPGAKVQLIVRCLENTTSMILATGCHMTASEYDNYGDVDYRLDAVPMRTVSMLPSTDNRSLGLWSGRLAIPMIKRMFGKETMLMRFTAYSESRSEVTFHIAGLEKQITPLRKACHW